MRTPALCLWWYTTLQDMKPYTLIKGSCKATRFYLERGKIMFTVYDLQEEYKATKKKYMETRKMVHINTMLRLAQDIGYAKGLEQISYVTSTPKKKPKGKSTYEVLYLTVVNGKLKRYSAPVEKPTVGALYKTVATADLMDCQPYAVIGVKHITQHLKTGDRKTTVPVYARCNEKFKSLSIYESVKVYDIMGKRGGEEDE